MKSPRLVFALLAVLVVALPGRKAAQAEVFNFPQTHDTTFGIQSVRDALGVVEGNVHASIAGAVLKVNAETALGIGNLATLLKKK